MKIKVLTMLTMCVLMLCTMFVQPVKATEMMTCVLIPGSVTTNPVTGIICALYNCPNGEQVQSCNLPEVTVE